MIEQFFVVKVRNGRLGAVCGPYDRREDASADMSLGHVRAEAIDAWTAFDENALIGTSNPTAYAHFCTQVAKVKEWLAAATRHAGTHQAVVAAARRMGTCGGGEIAGRHGRGGIWGRSGGGSTGSGTA